MKLSGNKKGFTLVEMLIVIAIVGMLSTMAVTGYMGYRKSTVLDLTVDNFISQLNQMRSNTIYGKADSVRFDEIQTAVDSGRGEIVFAENLSKCFGVYFEREGEYFVVESFEQDFVGKKIWSEGKWVYQGCPEPVAADLETLTWDDQVVVKEIEGFDDGLFLRALPPDGKLDTNGAQNLIITLGYQDETDPKYMRSVSIDIAGGKFTISDENTEIQQ